MLEQTILTATTDAWLEAIFMPAILTVIYAVHALWVTNHAKKDSQQVIALVDFTKITNFDDARNQGLTLIGGNNVCYDTVTRNEKSLDLPEVQPGNPEPGIRREKEAFTVSGDTIRQALVCDDELTAGDNSEFLQAVKVNGDLNIPGNAVFHKAVVVNGNLNLRESGRAHFLSGILVKGDCDASGKLLIGSRSNQGWAVVRQIGFKNHLHINGQMLVERATKTKENA